MAEVAVTTGPMTAEWRDLVMITWSVAPDLVAPRLPKGLAIDTWNDRALVSIVGLRWLDLRIAGLPVPGYDEFEQVNLRFYVRRTIGETVRRGVVFIKHIVPSLTMSLGARLWFNENMIATAMRHDIQHTENGWAKYDWLADGLWQSVMATRTGSPFLPSSESIETFIKERPYGYSRQRDGSTLEYSVDHPEWQVWKAHDGKLDVDVASVYGNDYVDALHADPISQFIAVGSEAALHPGHTIP